MKAIKYKLGELLRVTRGASLPGTGYADSGRYLRLTLANFNEEGGFKEFKSTQGKYFIETFDRRFLMHKGDLITPLTEQSPGLLGSVAFIPCDDLYIQSQDVGLVTCNAAKLDKRFAYYLFLTRSVREQISARSQQTKIRHTSPDKIADVEVHLPDLPTQLRIAGVMGLGRNRFCFRLNHDSPLPFLTTIVLWLSARSLATCLPFLVMRYFWRRLFGFSGMVSSINPSSSKVVIRRTRLPNMRDLPKTLAISARLFG